MDRLHDILARVPRATAELPPVLAPALAWRLAAGPALGGRSRALELRAGTLRVQADDAATAQQAMSVAPELLRELRRMLGENQVQRLEVSLHG